MCFDRTFAELRAIAESTGARTPAELDPHVMFGQRCGLCRPYVERTLRTGQVVFEGVLAPDGD